MKWGKVKMMKYTHVRLSLCPRDSTQNKTPAYSAWSRHIFFRPLFSNYVLSSETGGAEISTREWGVEKKGGNRRMIGKRPSDDRVIPVRHRCVFVFVSVVFMCAYTFLYAYHGITSVYTVRSDVVCVRSCHNCMCVNSCVACVYVVCALYMCTYVYICVHMVQCLSNVNFRCVHRVCAYLQGV